MAWTIYRSGLYLGQPLTPGTAHQTIAIAANRTMQVMIQVPNNTTLTAYCSTYNDVTTYFATSDYGVNSSTGAPTSYTSSGTNSSYQATYSNSTGSTVTVYIYLREAYGQAVAQSDNTLVYSFASYTPSTAWSAVTATLNVPTSAGNYATTSISTLGAGKYLNATFTPTVTGTYQCWSQFTGDAYMFIGPTTMSVSNTNGAVTGSTTSNDDGANNAFGSGNYGSNQPFCEISLTANTTYRMVIRHYSSTSSPTSSIGAGTVYIGLKIWHRAQNMSSSTSLTSFTAGTPKTLVASAGDIANGTYYIYPFTVDTTGQYYIASGVGTISGDTYGFISTTQSWITALTGTTRTLRSGTILASDDDSNGNSQYKITANLTAGTTYYLYHMGYSTTSTSSGNPITVTLVSGGSGVNKAYIASGSAYSSTWVGSSMNYPAYVIGKGTTKNTVLNPQSITTINFVLSYTPTGTELGSWDASEDVDGSITAYALADGKTLVVAKTSSSSDKIYYKNGSTCVLTEHMYYVTNITGCGNIDTSEVGWFYYTLSEYSGTSVPSGMETWNVSSATHFDGFFWNCTDLTNIVLYWNTASAVNMSGLFYNCHSAQNIQIPNLDTRHCTNLGNMFDSCTAARSITVGSNFTRMGSGSTNLTNFPNPAAFYGTVPAGSVVIDKWRNTTTNVEYTYDNIPNLTAATYVLYGNPTKAYLASGTTNSTTWNSSGKNYPAYLIGKGTVKNTFLNPDNLTTINFVLSYTPTGTELGSWDASDNVDGSITAYALADGVTITVAKTSNRSDKIYAKNSLKMTYNISNVATITGCGNIDVSEVDNFASAFYYYKGTSIPDGVSSWNVSAGTYFAYCFWYCMNLTNITLSWNTPLATSMDGMFFGCYRARDIWIPNLDTRNCSVLSDFFDTSSQLSTVRITVGSNFTRMGSGSTNLINFPNPSNFTTIYGSSIPTDSALLNKWRSVTTNVEYTYDNVPNLTQDTYVLYGSDGRPTLATYAPGTGDNSSYRNLSGSYIPYWLYTGYQRASVPAAALRAITRIETRDSYSGTANYSWDASLYKDGRVHCYINGTTLIIAGNGSGYIDLGQYSNYLFSWLPNLVTIDVPLLNTYNPTNTNFSPKCKTQSFSFMCAYSANIEEINISGINFYNMPNSSWKIYVYSLTNSGGTYTTVFPAKLSKLTVGNKYKTDCAGPITTPTAGNTVVPNDGSTFDGNWHDETGTSYTPGSIASNGQITYPSFPSQAAHVYTAYMPYIPTPEYHSVWKLYNGTEWVVVYPQVYNGSSWNSLKGMVYDTTDNEWK